MSIVYDHCETVYKALAERAIINQRTQELVFTGSITEVFKSLGISQAHYAPIFRTLEDVGSTLKLQRGGRNVDTVMVLRGLPDEWPAPRTRAPLTPTIDYDTMVLDVKKIQESIGDLSVIEALMNLDTRLSRLEAKQSKEPPHGKGK